MKKYILAVGILTCFFTANITSNFNNQNFSILNTITPTINLIKNPRFNDKSIPEGASYKLNTISANKFLIWANGPIHVELNSLSHDYYNVGTDTSWSPKINDQTYQVYVVIFDQLNIPDAKQYYDNISENDLVNSYAITSNNSSFLSSNYKNLVLQKGDVSHLDYDYDLYIADINNAQSTSLTIDLNSLNSFLYQNIPAADIKGIPLISINNNSGTSGTSITTYNGEYKVTTGYPQLSKTYPVVFSDSKNSQIDKAILTLEYSLNIDNSSSNEKMSTTITMHYLKPDSNGNFAFPHHVKTSDHKKGTWSDTTKKIVGGVCTLLLGLFTIFISYKYIEYRRRKKENFTNNRKI